MERTARLDIVYLEFMPLFTSLTYSHGYRASESLLAQTDAANHALQQHAAALEVQVASAEERLQSFIDSSQHERQALLDEQNAFEDRLANARKELERKLQVNGAENSSAGVFLLSVFLSRCKVGEQVSPNRLISMMQCRRCPPKGPNT